MVATALLALGSCTQRDAPLQPADLDITLVYAFAIEGTESCGSTASWYGPGEAGDCPECAFHFAALTSRSFDLDIAGCTTEPGWSLQPFEYGSYGASIDFSGAPFYALSQSLPAYRGYGYYQEVTYAGSAYGSFRRVDDDVSWSYARTYEQTTTAYAYWDDCTWPTDEHDSHGDSSVFQGEVTSGWETGDVWQLDATATDLTVQVDYEDDGNGYTTRLALVDPSGCYPAEDVAGGESLSTRAAGAGWLAVVRGDSNMTETVPYTLTVTSSGAVAVQLTHANAALRPEVTRTVTRTLDATGTLTVEGE